MKKQFVLLPLILMVAASFNGAMKASAEDLPISTDWTNVTNGPTPTTIHKTDNGYCMTHMTNYGQVGYFNQKVKLDGLTFDVRATGINDGDTFGYYLSTTKDTGGLSWKNPTFTIWKGLYNGQSRINVATSHDYNENSVVYSSPDKTSEKGFGVASSGVMNNVNDSGTAGVRFSFSKYDDNFYAIKMIALTGVDFWGNNANYNKDDKSTTVYLAIDETTNLSQSEYVYIHYVGFKSSGNETSDPTIYFENMQYKVDLTETKNEAKAKVNSRVDLSKYAEADHAKITEIKETAIAAIDAATSLEKINEALDAFNTAMSAYKTLAQAYVENLYKEAPTELGHLDETANFLDYYQKGYSTKRLNNEGGTIVAMQGVYGSRGGIPTTMSPTNFEFEINAARISKEVAMTITIGKNPYTYVSEDDAIIAFDVIRLSDDGQYFITFTNTSAHNASVAAFGTEKWHGDYTGRYITSENGDLHFKVTTNDMTEQTIITINDVRVALESTVVFNRLGDTEKGYFSFGVMTSETMEVFAIKTIFDADEKVYLGESGPLKMIVPALEEIETAMANGMSDEVYKNYFLGNDSKANKLTTMFEALHAHDAKIFETRYNAIKNAGTEYAPTYDKNTRVNEVVEAINAIGEVTENSKTAIENAETLYTALPDDYKSSVTNYETLTTARATYEKILADKAEAAKINSVINLIDLIGDVTENSLEDITAAEEAYNALTDAQKARVTNAATLAAARAAYDKLMADKASVEATIKAINEIGEVTLDSKAKIEKAESLYNALSDELKAKVTNATTLTAARATYNDLVSVDNVIKAIDAIGEVTKDSQEAIENAESLYNALSDELKAKVTNYDVLEAARATLTKLNKKGCSGAIASVSLVATMIALGGMVLSFKKRKEEC